MTKMLLVFLLVLNFSLSLFGQKSVVPLFQEIEFASYVTSSDGEIVIHNYYKIDYTAKVFFYDHWEAEEHYYSFMLPDSVVKKLNAVFNNSRQLASYKVQDKLETGMHYAGDYYYLSLYFPKNKRDSITYIYPYMSDDFHAAANSIYPVFYEQMRKGETSKIEIDKRLIEKLKESHHKTKNLPQIELPPPAAPPVL